MQRNTANMFLFPDVAVHNLTDVCWKKCITGNIKSGQLDKNEITCTENCVQRFLDTNESILGHLQKLQGR